MQKEAFGHSMPCCHHHAARNPIYCIVPPYLLDRAAENITSPQRRQGFLLTAKLTEDFRRERRTSNAVLGPLRRARALQRDILPFQPAGAGQKMRVIYDGGNRTRLPGTPVRREGDPNSGDREVDEAYEYMGATYDFYWDIFHRDSINAQGMPLLGTVHYGVDYSNAFWNSQQMVYGDGDGEVFNPFTRSVDVIGHELTHGVTENEAGLIYWKDTGAINESISDVFGCLVKQYSNHLNNIPPSNSDWIIGEGLFTSSVNGVGIRSMSAPGTAYNDPKIGKDPQPGDMSGYVNTLQDNGGVHINSGIPNHAFYLAATNIGGAAWDKPGRIWYETVVSPWLGRITSFRWFAQLTRLTAIRLYGFNSLEEQGVREAWAEVGISI